MSTEDSFKAGISAVLQATADRRLAEARAEIERETAADMAELHRLAAKYNLRVVSADSVDPTPLSGPPSEPPSTPKSAEERGLKTLAELDHLYRTDPRSPYRELRFAVRSSADGLLDRMMEAYGDVRLADLNADGIKKLYDSWAADGKLSAGHSFATKLRGLFSFGTVTLDDPGCQRLSTIMNRMRFPNPPARTERLTADQVVAIRKKAHELGKPSLALAQAIQFQLHLTQKDTIGDWVPVTEPGASDIVLEGNKWLYGIRWEEIDENLILRHSTSFANKPLVLDLKKAPMVLEELQRLPNIPKKGPVIISEWSDKPWSAPEFRRWWRRLADAAGVPKSMKNMDSSKAADRSSSPANTTSQEVADKEFRLH